MSTKRKADASAIEEPYQLKKTKPSGQLDTQIDNAITCVQTTLPFLVTAVWQAVAQTWMASLAAVKKQQPFLLHHFKMRLDPSIITEGIQKQAEVQLISAFNPKLNCKHFVLT